jgi:hypothetical protein
MQAMHKKIQALVAAAILMATTAGCHRAATATSEDGGASGVSEGNVGIPECDDYLAKYARCIADKVPSDQRKAFEDALQRTRATWKTLAANSGARPGLPQACSLARQTAQTTLKQYACVW